MTNNLRSYRRFAVGVTSLTVLLACAGMATGQQDGGISGVVVTFERVFESGEGRRSALERARCT